MTDIPKKINKGGVYVMNNEKSPRVVVRWGEENKTKVKNFCINGKRNEEQALEEANRFYEENIRPKYEVWKKYNDEQVQQNKRQYRNEWNRNYFSSKWICECGYETTRGYKTRHLQSVYHELGMKKINVSTD